MNKKLFIIIMIQAVVIALLVGILIGMRIEKSRNIR